MRVLEEQDLAIEELVASFSILEKLVEDRNKGEGSQKVEECVGGSVVPREFQSSDMEFGCHNTLVEHNRIDMQFKGEGDIS